MLVSLQVLLVLAFAASSHAQSTYNCPSLLTSSHQDTSDCGKYWVCENGVSYSLNCQSEYVYDPVQAKCVTGVEPAGCSMPTSFRDTTAFVCPFANGYSVESTACDVFYECINYVATKKYCLTGYLFDLAVKQCVNNYVPAGCSSTTYRQTTAYICPSGTAITYVADINDCTSYYRCPEGTRLTCSQGYFDPVTDRCGVSYIPQGCSTNTLG